MNSVSYSSAILISSTIFFLEEIYVQLESGLRKNKTKQDTSPGEGSPGDSFFPLCFLEPLFGVCMGGGKVVGVEEYQPKCVAEHLLKPRDGKILVLQELETSRMQKVFFISNWLL